MSTAPAPAPNASPTTDEPASPSALNRIAAALTYRDFRVLWFGAFLSTIGTWMQKVAQSWLVLTIAGTSSAFFLGLDSFLGELLVHPFDRHRIDGAHGDDHIARLSSLDASTGADDDVFSLSGCVNHRYDPARATRNVGVPLA